MLTVWGVCRIGPTASQFRRSPAPAVVIANCTSLFFPPAVGRAFSRAVPRMFVTRGELTEMKGIISVPEKRRRQRCRY